MATLSPERREEIVLAHLSLAYRICRDRRYRTWGLHLDELEQAAAVGLVIASQSYDDERNVPFGAYCRDYVARSIWEAITENLVGSEHVPITRDVPEPGSDPRTERLQSELHDALEALTPDEQHLLIRRFGLDDRPPMGLIDMADHFGCSARQMTRLLGAAKENLDRELRRRGWDVYRRNEAYGAEPEQKLA
jgi:RNA polymerase sigma factor (sigma-70 family)